MDVQPLHYTKLQLPLPLPVPLQLQLQPLQLQLQLPQLQLQLPRLQLQLQLRLQVQVQVPPPPLHYTTLHHTTSCGCAPVTAPSPGTCPRCPAVRRTKRPTCGSTSAQRCQPLHDPARTQRPRCHPEAHGHPRH